MIKQVFMRSLDHNYEKTVELVFSDKIEGKIEVKAKDETIVKSFVISKDEILAVVDGVRYQIKGKFLLSESVFQDILKRVDNAFSTSNPIVVTRKNYRRLQEGDFIVEITQNKMRVKTVDLEIVINDKILDDREEPEVDKKTEIELMHMLVSMYLQMLLPLSQVLKCIILF